MTATTTQLALYNKATRHLGERKLASMTDVSEARRYLDDEYPDAVLSCLRAGLWNFAQRAIQVDASTTVIPEFGYNFAFPKPDDWIRTNIVSTDSTFDPPLRDYQDQGGYWLANYSPLFVKFVSATNGLVLANWPPDFAEFVGVFLANTIAPRITQNKDLAEAIDKKTDKLWKLAIARDAMDQAAVTMPLGTWSTSRQRRGAMSAVKPW